ncbi:BatD family protein [Myroides sp. WP-1]|uniref:BatD family protein n=1 Tax=Myroides sp. WP-1 TaxID=2759944 RepID=UPI0015FAB2DB|nr:BatD family protein [Myroides sp. WP-1]MBB1139471.1 BatD family protein [Myroides sp. WP-1]
MRSLYLHIVFFCILFTQPLLAQVSFEASVNKEQVPLNDVIQIEFTMNSDGDNFSPPSFEAFTVVGGPSSSVSYSWINGRKSFKKSYSFLLQPKRKGKFTIGKASIQIEGETLTTNPITITVTDAVERQDPRQRMNQMQQGSLDKVHLVAEVSKTKPFINEPISIVYKLYFNANVGGYRGNEIPTYDKFWTYNIEMPQRPELKQGKYKGELYNYVVLKQDIIMAQEVGKQIIKPLSLTVQVEVPTGRRDFFGFPEYGLVEKEYSSQSITIDAQDLPQKDRPADFSGGVGEFAFKVTPSKQELKAGESLNLTVSVSGKGNLNLVTLPTPVAHSALEVYDPQYSEKLTPTASGLQGNRTNKYTIIPQYKGEYNIDPMEFSYFDLASKQYKTIKTDTIKINVLDGPTLPTNKEVAGVDSPDDQDFFQKNKAKLTFVEHQKSSYWKTSLFYFLLFAPILAMPLFVLISRAKAARANDVEGNRLRRNNRLAKKYLSEAKKQMNDKALFYEALERCLHNFLKAKLQMETSEMSNDNITEILQEKAITPEAIQSFMSLKNACEWARYTPTEQVNIAKDYETAIDVIDQLEKQFKA